MTAALAETETESESDMATKGAHNTNVYVCLEYLGAMISAVYGPFISANAAKDWGLANSFNFTIAEIMRPEGVEEIAFVLVPKPREPTLEDQGISKDQSEIGDFIDPSVTR